MSLNRRAVLTRLTAGVAVPTALAGCLGGMPHDAVVKLDPASPPADAESPTDVVYADLPPAEQRIVRTAVEEGMYHACPELPSVVRSFADRIDEPGESYLTYQGETYGMWVRITDLIYATTASPPENEPSCGLF